MTEHKQKFDDLDTLIKNQDRIKRQANGGNSILFSYPPNEENAYINELRKIYTDKAEFIDVSKLLVKYIDVEGWDSFKDYYMAYQSTAHKVFSSDDPTVDLKDMIINAITEACQNNKIPFLIRSGCLFGTGIDSVNIMENDKVMSQSQPLVIFYPSKCENDLLYFLNFKPASKYRCTLVK
ncbi:MAG: DUF1788 domain-containing protein [Candidatus Kapabacteria bacterium]|nr:DUF1788 domain-containing protein [Candidatus Kapabacteria bacterium]